MRILKILVKTIFKLYYTWFSTWNLKGLCLKTREGRRNVAAIISKSINTQELVTALVRNGPRVRKKEE